jgi:hypothetical protein
MREQQESGIRKVTEVVQILSKLLKNYNYAFFKLIKPISYVPADVDILIDESQARKPAMKSYVSAIQSPLRIHTA